MQFWIKAADVTPGDGVAALAIISRGPVPVLAQHMRANLGTTRIELGPQMPALLPSENYLQDQARSAEQVIGVKQQHFLQPLH